MKSMKFSKKFSVFNSDKSLLKIEQIYLDDFVSHYSNSNGVCYPSLKDIVILKKYIKEYSNIRICDNNAENIYYEKEDNLGGITIPYEMLLKNHTSITIENEKVESNIKKLNILINDKILTFDIKDKMEKLEISLADVSGPKDKVMIISLNTNKEEIKYLIDKNGEYIERKKIYKISGDDIKDGVLDIRELISYNKIIADNLNINTLIINKEYLENIDKLDFLKWNSKNNDNIKIEKLRIIDHDDMRLMPFDKTFLCYENRNLVSKAKYNYVCLKIEEEEVLIYLDDKNNIKIIKKSELLKNKDIDDVIFRFIDTVSSYNHGRKLSLILVKYKNGMYKVIDFDEIYDITEMFTNFVCLKDGYLNYDEKLSLKQENDWIKIFNSGEFENYTFYRMINDYEKYKKYLKKLNDIGLSEDAINYLFNRNINSILLNDTDFNIEDLSEKEIDTFNELGEHYTKKLKK